MEKFKSANKIKFLPIITVAWLLITIICSYSMAVIYKHIYPVWPYISDTGTTPPESSYFGLMLNYGSLLIGVIVYCQYQQINLKMTPSTNKRLRHLNVVSLVFGIISAIGGTFVACFQLTSSKYMHVFGAAMAFGVGTGYFITQTILCSLLNGGDRTGYRLNIFRVFLCVIICIMYAMIFIFGILSRKMYLTQQEVFHFNPKMKYYEYRLASTFSQWALYFCFCLYMLTFYYDLKYLKANLDFYDSRKKNQENQA